MGKYIENICCILKKCSKLSTVSHKHLIGLKCFTVQCATMCADRIEFSEKGILPFFHQMYTILKLKCSFDEN